MTENIANFCVELDAVFNDGGLKQAYNSFYQAEREVSAIFENLKNKSQENTDIIAQTTFSGFSALRSGLEDFYNFTSESFMQVDTLIKSVWDNMVDSFFSAISKMMANNILASIFGGGGLFGGGGGLFGSLFGGILGSRRSGGPIEKTGPYYLHEGEFVLPPEVVSAVNSTSGTRNDNVGNANSGSIGLNVTVNTPITINGSADRNEAQKLCEEISRAARRGVSWAVDQAKISYKIGRDRSSESAL